MIRNKTSPEEKESALGEGSKAKEAGEQQIQDSN
jgi:hypothetical protein